MRDMKDLIRCDQVCHNYLKMNYDVTAEELMLDKAHLLGLTAPEMTVLVGGMRSMGISSDQRGLFVDTKGKLTNSFFDKLLDMGVSWKPTGSNSYEATDKISSDNYWKIENINKKITKKYDIYLSNELIDSFPVHRFRIRSNKIKEIFVGIKNNQLTELEFPSLNDEINKRISPLINTLPEGYTGEVCDEYNSWAKRISVLIPSGVLISIDYGYEKSEFYDPSRKNGLLRCYDQNTINQNPFLKPGKQDITTHVDFTSVNEELNKLGIKKIFDISQYELLKKLGIENLIDDLENQYINNKINKKVYQQNLNAIYILTNPNGLGKFRVLLHSTKDLYDKLNKSKNKIFKKINDIQCPIITKNNEYINFLSISKKDDNIIENKTWKEIFDL